MSDVNSPYGVMIEKTPAPEVNRFTCPWCNAQMSAVGMHPDTALRMHLNQVSIRNAIDAKQSHLAARAMAADKLPDTM